MDFGSHHFAIRSNNLVGKLYCAVQTKEAEVVSFYYQEPVSNCITNISPVNSY